MILTPLADVRGKRQNVHVETSRIVALALIKLWDGLSFSIFGIVAFTTLMISPYLAMGFDAGIACCLCKDLKHLLV